MSPKFDFVMSLYYEIYHRLYERRSFHLRVGDLCYDCTFAYLIKKLRVYETKRLRLLVVVPETYVVRVRTTPRTLHSSTKTVSINVHLYLSNP